MTPPLQTVQMLALEVKDGDLFQWQIALCDLAVLHGRISPDTLMLNIHLNQTEVRQ